MLRCGLRLDDLGTERLTWRDLRILVTRAVPGTAIYIAGNEYWYRTPELEFLRSTEHSLRWLVWAKTRDGQRGLNVPERIRMPWDEPDWARPDALDWADAKSLGWTRD